MKSRLQLWKLGQRTDRRGIIERLRALERLWRRNFLYLDIKTLYAQTGAPTTTDDVDSGFSVGSRWFDETADVEYVCLDATAGAAVWRHSSYPLPVQSVTLAAAATAIAITSDFVIVTGDAGANTVATITGGVAGDRLDLLFVDALVTITDDNTHAADTIDLSAAFTSADDTILSLRYDGTSWYERSRSVN